MGRTPLYRCPAGVTYTLDDLTVDVDGSGPIAEPADARAIDALDLNGEYTIDLGASGLLRLTRVA